MEKEPNFSFKESFPLHYYAKTGNIEALEFKFKNDPPGSRRQLERFDFKGRTALHYAAMSVNATDGAKCAEKIIKFLNTTPSDIGTREKFAGKMRRHTQKVRKQQWKGNDHPETVDFINTKDVEKETAIHLAAKNENTEIVQCLLLHSADVFSISKSGEQTLNLIYSKTPSAVTALLNRSVSFQHGVDADSFIMTERSYSLDFTAVIGENQSEHDERIKSMETLCLHVVNSKDIKVRREILTHPLVRFFIFKKVSKLRLFVYMALFMQLLWIALYIWHAMEIYYSCCDMKKDSIQFPEGSTCKVVPFCSKYPFVKNFNDTFKSEDCDQADAAAVLDHVKDCVEDNDSIPRAIFILLFTAYIFSSIGFQIVTLKFDYLKIRNVVQWVYICGMLITLFPTSDNFFRTQFQITAFCVLLAAIIILDVINKHIYWAIYIRVLLQVIWRFVQILPLFFFLMLAFSVAVWMMFPSSNLSLRNFRDAIMRVFATTANGKVEWEEGNEYKDDISDNFEEAGIIMFIVFYVVLVLLLFRILIGFVVADTKKIQEEEEVNELSLDLDEIFLFESFVTSRIYTWASSLRFVSRVLNKLRNNAMLCEKGVMEMTLKESDIPTELRKPMRVMATKNPIKKPIDTWRSRNQQSRTLLDPQEEENQSEAC